MLRYLKQALDSIHSHSLPSVIPQNFYLYCVQNGTTVVLDKGSCVPYPQSCLN